MDKQLKQFIEDSRALKLTANEREQMRLVLEKVIHDVPVRGGLSGRHTWWSAITTTNHFKLRPMSLFLIIALIVGGGTSLAAEKSLPGDALYPVKVGINEEVRGFFAVSETAEADWQSKRAERRLEEVEKLVVENRLNAETRAEAETRLAEHLQGLIRASDRLMVKTEATAGASLSAELDQATPDRNDPRARAKELIDSKIKARTDTEVKTEIEAETEIDLKIGI